MSASSALGVASIVVACAVLVYLVVSVIRAERF